MDGDSVRQSPIFFFFANIGVSEGIAHPRKWSFTMRTTKRFTPAVLLRFARQGRGNGILANYTAWHRVSRGDPASSGRSHVQQLAGRQRDLLSDLEWVALFFAYMLPNLFDLREQFPLALTSGRHELTAYGVDALAGHFLGTIELAQKLGIKHPVSSENGEKAFWRPTTDLLLTLVDIDGQFELLAISIKPKTKLSKRKRELLALEKAYWDERGVTWLLITPKEYEKSVAVTLRSTMPYVIGSTVPEAQRALAAEFSKRHHGRSLNSVLYGLAAQLGDMTKAQRAFWQAVWSGLIRLDLRRDWRPHHPIVLLSEQDYQAQNPIASRRSAWN